MNIRLLIGGFVLGAATALVGTHAFSQDVEPGWQQPSPEEMEAMMKAWQETTAPGAPHKRLEYFVGEWDTTMRMWMAGPDAPPSETEGTAKMTMILGGRYVRQEWTGSMMGMPMEGLGFTGYDNFKKRYTQVWIDDHSTAMNPALGTIDQTGKAFTFFGQMDEPMTGEHDKMVKYTTRIIDEDSFAFEIHDLAIVPGETKVIEVLYERVNSAASAGD